MSQARLRGVGREIDRLMYDLYSLIDEEIVVVKAGTAR